MLMHTEQWYHFLTSNIWSEKCDPKTSSFQSGFGCRLSSGHSVTSMSLDRNDDTEEAFRRAPLTHISKQSESESESFYCNNTTK